MTLVLVYDSVIFRPSHVLCMLASSCLRAILLHAGLLWPAPRKKSQCNAANKPCHWHSKHV